MTETIARPELSPQNALPNEEALRLECPRCGGWLNLKRRHLGLKGQCVHCRAPLTALEEGGVVRVIGEEASVAIVSPAVADAVASPELPACPAPPEIPAEEPSVGEALCPALASTASPPALLELELPESLAIHPEEESFGGRREALTPPEPTPEPVGSPFGGDAGFALSFDSPFASEAESHSIAPAWNARFPSEGHTGSTPFGGTGSGNSYADSLFRQTGTKPSPAGMDGGGEFTPSVPSASSVGNGDPEAPATPRRDSQERVILDGDGRPMRPMTKEEEAAFASNFFKYQNARSKPRWVKRLRKAAIRFLIAFCVVGFGVGGVAVIAPKEKVLAWKVKAIEFLKPGMAILDFLPDNLRPDWLPRTEFGIDAGVDENGAPKKKLNAFEGLDKLKGDVGEMRGAADAQLEELKNL